MIGRVVGSAMVATVGVWAVLCRPAAAASDPGPTHPSGRWLAVGALAGGGLVAGSPTLGMEAAASLRLGRFDVLLGAPLRFELSGGLRRSDWDELDEVLRPLRRLRWQGEQLDLRAGELTAITIGRGELLSAYVGNPGPDHHASGVSMRLRLEPFELDLLVDDLPRIDLAAVRIALRPGRVHPELGVVVRRWTVALTLAADFRSAWRSATPGSGPPGELSTPSVPFVAGASLAGECLLLPLDWFRVSPFLSAAVLGSEGPTAGVGFHAGLRLRAAVADARGALELRGAVVIAGPGYLPGLFGPLYRVERFAAPLTASGPAAPGAPPLARLLASLEPRVVATFEGDLDLGDLRVAAGYTTPRGGGVGHRWWTRAHLPPIGPVQGTFLVAGDGTAVLLGAVETSLQFGWLVLRAELSREWVTSDAPETYRPATSFWLGAGAAASWVL